MASYLELFFGVVALLIASYYYWTCYYDFWRKRGVAGPKPHPFFCNLWKLTLARIGIADVAIDVYKKYKHEPVVGLFEGLTPILVVHDPDVIKKILITDFASFQERSHSVHERTEPMSLNLFHLDAPRWRMLRPKITPIFTASQLRDMFTLMVECSKNLDGYLHDAVETGESVEVRELLSKYSMDVIGSCGFGINMNTETEYKSEMRRMGKRIFEVCTENILRLKMSLFCPELYNLLGYILPERTLSRYFTKTVTSLMKYRKEHGIYRPDFINMLMEFKQHPEWFEGIELTDTLLSAQAFSFFAAGYESTSTILSWVLYELAQNHDIQDKVHKEIAAYHDKYGDTFTVDSLKEMIYLDKVFKEALRKYPAAAITLRRTTSEYTFDTLKFTLPKQTNVWIPNIAFQRDPEIFPDPEKFDPERFGKGQEETRQYGHYLPFGGGPRNCIGARFAILVFNLGLMKIFRTYKVDVCEKTRIPHEFDIGAFNLQPKGGIYLKLTKIE